MRRFALALLLATTTAAPALAQSSPEQRRAAREQARVEKAERADGRAERRERTAERRERAAERPEEARAPTLVPRDEEHPPRPAIDRAIERGRASTAADSPRPRLDQRRQDNNDSVANWRREERDAMREARSERLGDRFGSRTERRRLTPPPEARPDRPAPAPRTAARRTGSPRWASSWRDDRRYNWRDHRRRHGSLFRLGFYFDPFGWSYRRYHRGWRLWPSYYERSYWLDDPYSYRLPYAPYPYRWIRYYNDALLIDLHTGEVVDVAHDFFW